MLVLYFDGSCEPTNPGGIATAAWVLKRDDKIVHRGTSLVGEGEGMTNNVAEYAALLWGLHHALKVAGEGEELLVCGDSQLVVNQASGAWQCRAENLMRYCSQAKEQASRFSSVEWRWIPKAENVTAHNLAHGRYLEHLRSQSDETNSD